MDSASVPKFLKPFIQELLDSFAVATNSGQLAVDVFSLTTEEILNLLAPPASCDFAVTEAVAGSDNHSKIASTRFHDFRSPDGNSINSLRRSKSAKKKPPRKETTTSVRTAGNSSVEQTSSDSRVRALIQLYGGLQKENLETAKKIQHLRRRILEEFSGVLSEGDLDQLTGVGRNISGSFELKNAVMELLIRKKSFGTAMTQPSTSSFIDDLFLQMPL